jgi:hypothetical protein
MCTNNKARKTTPTWHTSNNESARGAACGCPVPKADAAKLEDGGAVELSDAGVSGSAKVCKQTFGEEQATRIDRQEPGRLDRIGTLRGVWRVAHCLQLRRSGDRLLCVIPHTS